jgi:hypothetical protein
MPANAVEEHPASTCRLRKARIPHRTMSHSRNVILKYIIKQELIVVEWLEFLHREIPVLKPGNDNLNGVYLAYNTEVSFAVRYV